MTLPPEKIGDRGQRYEIRYAEKEPGRRTKDGIVGWSAEREGAEDMAATWEKRGPHVRSWVVDRQPPEIPAASARLLSDMRSCARVETMAMIQIQVSGIKLWARGRQDAARNWHPDPAWSERPHMMGSLLWLIDNGLARVEPRGKPASLILQLTPLGNDV